jgi:recombination protein RecA
MALLETLQKKFGKTGLFLLKDGEEFLTIEKVPTGIRTLDSMLGGGLPLGRIVEISGPEGVGKTSLSLQIARAYQEAMPDKKIVFIDVEGGNTQEFVAETYGLDTHMTIYKRAQAGDTAEILLSMIEECASSDEVSLVILDSLASLVSEQDGDKGLPDGFRDNRPQLYSRFLRRLTRRPATAATVILLNQLRMKQNAQPNEDPWYETGGMGLRYYPSLRVRLFHAGRVKNGAEENIGFKVRALVHKARYSTPRRSCSWIIDFVEGLDTTRAILDMAIERGLVVRKGSWFNYGDQKWQGLEAVLVDMRASDKLLTDMESKLVFSDE